LPSIWFVPSYAVEQMIAKLIAKPMQPDVVL